MNVRDNIEDMARKVEATIPVPWLIKQPTKRAWGWLVHVPPLILAVALFPVAVMVALYAYAFVRKRKSEGRFPNLEFPEVTTTDEHRVQLFDDGASVFEDMLEAIEQAREMILLEIYIFERDEVGMRFKRALMRKARQGVKVYIIFDGVGSLHVPMRFLFGWRSGIRVFEYGTLRQLRSYLKGQAWVRDHRKILVVDGKVAYLGGMNLGREYARTWRDTQLKLVGPAARTVAHEFANLWNSQYGRHRITLPYEPADTPSISIVSNRPFESFFPIKTAYIDAIKRAQRNIYITNAYFIPDFQVLEALGEAAKRGVDVQIMLPAISDNIGVDWMARSLLLGMLDHKARVFMYKGTMLHSKTMTVDGHWSTVGSANLDARSLDINYEINAIIDDEQFGRQMEAMFLNDRTRSEEICRDVWCARPWPIRFGEFCVGPLRGWF